MLHENMLMMVKISTSAAQQRTVRRKSRMISVSEEPCITKTINSTVKMMVSTEVSIKAMGSAMFCVFIIFVCCVVL